MADDEEFDPNANVPLWVNIVIPIISVVIFVGALVVVYFLPYEIDVERLELWVSYSRVRGYKTFFMLNSAEHEIYLAHKC